MLHLSRRKLLKGVLVSGAILPFCALPVWGGTENAQVLVLSCIDFRFIRPLENFLAQQGLEGHYDWTALAGASLALANFPHTSDADAFWDQLNISYQLHHIQKVLIFDHQDCGAYEMLHPNLSQNLDEENRLHSSYALNAAQIIKNRYPDLQIEAYFVTLQGDIKPLVKNLSLSKEISQPKGKLTFV